MVLPLVVTLALEVVPLALLPPVVVLLRPRPIGIEKSRGQARPSAFGLASPRLQQRISSRPPGPRTVMRKKSSS